MNPTTYRQLRRSGGALLVERQMGEKISPVRHVPYRHPASGRVFRRPISVAPYASATYASIAATCPSDCPLRGDGCYAQDGMTGRAVRRLDAEASGRAGVAVILAEAELVRRAFAGGPVPQDGARGGRDLRLHVSGDVPTEGADYAARALAAAAADWRRRGGGAVFTYTHQWHRARRADWGSISVLASCDQPCEVDMARRRGYAAALVVGAHPSERAYSVPGVEARVVPCPAQTRGSNCAECRLCLDRDLLALGVTISFAAHGLSRGARKTLRARAWRPGDGLRVLP